MLNRWIAFICLVVWLPACHSTLPQDSSSPDYARTIDEIDWESRIVEWSSVEEDHAANAAAAEKLKRTADVAFEQHGLDMVFLLVKDFSGLDIVVDWPALELVGIEQDTPVTFEMKNMPLERVLSTALQQAGAEQFDDDKPGYVIVDGVVEVSTVRLLKADVFTKIYNVERLLVQNAPSLELLYPKNKDAVAYARALIGEELEDFEPGLFGTSSGGIFAERNQEGLSRQEWLDVLENLIEETVGDSDEWLDAQSIILEVGPRLVIKTSRSNHAEIAALLANMHRWRAERFQRLAALVEVFRLLREAEEHRLAQDDWQALRLVNEALRVDPENPEALALREILQRSMGW